MSILRLARLTMDVEEVGSNIVITGVSADELAHNIRKLFNTTKVASSMFIEVGWSKVVIPKFFALELIYVLNKLLDLSGRDAYGVNKSKIRSLIKYLQDNTWVRTTLSDPVQWLDRSVQKELIYDKLLPHQEEFVNVYERQKIRYQLKGMLLSAAAGSGKTITSCFVALAAKADKVIVVCPNNATHRVWQKTLNEEFKVPQNPWISKDNPGKLDPKAKWSIFHYENLDRAIELAKGYHGQNVFLILDESHNFNEVKSIRTQRLLSIAAMPQVKDVLFLSGTPVKALGFETIPLLRAVDPMFSPEAENSFRKMFGRDAKRTLHILAHRLGLISHTTRKDQVMSDKPVFEEIRVKMPNSAKYTLDNLGKLMAEFIVERTKYYSENKHKFESIFRTCIEIHKKTLTTPQQKKDFDTYYATIEWLRENKFDARFDADKAVTTNKYEKEIIHPSLPRELRNQFIDAKAVIKYVHLKIRGECLGRILSKERVNCHVDMLEHIDFTSLINSVEKKTLVFTNYVNVVDSSYELLSKQGFKPAKVYGATNNELASIVANFAKDASINPLIATYDSLSTAVPLTMANGIIFLNAPWRSYIREQAVARAHRIGQDKTVYCYDIILDTGNLPNISSRSLDIMTWSKEQVDAIMGISGDLTVSMESNGFVGERVEDVNEVIEDLTYPDAEFVFGATIAPTIDTEEEDRMIAGLAVR